MNDHIQRVRVAGAHDPAFVFAENGDSRLSHDDPHDIFGVTMEPETEVFLN
jgi:hypothetical protein